MHDTLKSKLWVGDVGFYRKSGPPYGLSEATIVPRFGTRTYCIHIGFRMDWVIQNKVSRSVVEGIVPFTIFKSIHQPLTHSRKSQQCKKQPYYTRSGFQEVP
jgi:hypothetical protein